MEIGLEALTIAIFGLLPGFITASLAGTISGRPVDDDVKVTLFSLVTSLALFVASIGVLGALGQIEPVLDLTIANLKEKLLSIKVSQAGTLFLTMMIGAIALGVIAGRFADMRLGKLLYDSGLSPIAPESNTFTQAITERFSTEENLRLVNSGKMAVPWLRLKDGERTVFGRLRLANIKIAAHEPFEIYLEPYFYFENGKIVLPSTFRQLSQVGLYAHILPSQMVEVWHAEESWMPRET